MNHVVCIQIRRLDCEDGTLYIRLRTDLGKNAQFNSVYHALKTVLVHVTPVLVTMVTTGLLVRFVRQRKRERRAVLCKTGSGNVDVLDNLTTCLIAIATCFLLLVTPHSVYSVLLRANFYPCAVVQFGWVTLTLGVVNSSVNFFIYFWKLVSFRRAVKKTIACRGDEPEAGGSVTSVGSGSSVRTVEVSTVS